MATITEQLRIEIAGTNRFLANSVKINESLKRINEQANTTVTSLNKLSSTLQNLANKSNVKITGLEPNTLEASSIAVESLRKNLTKLKDLGTVDFDISIDNIGQQAQQIQTLLKALASGARAETITNKATAIERFVDALNNLSRISNIDSSINNITELNKSISSISRSSSIEKFPDRIDSIVTGLNKLNSTDFQSIGENLRNAIPELSDFAAIAKQLNNIQNVGQKLNAMNQQAIARQQEAKNAAINYNAALIQLGASILRLAPQILNLGKGLLALPFKVVTASANVLHKVFISLPIKAVTGAFNLLLKAVQLVIKPFQLLIDGLIRIDISMNRVKRALGVLLAPFRAILSIVMSLTSAMMKLINVFNIFSTSSNKAERSTAQTGKNLKVSQQHAETLANSYSKLSTNTQQSTTQIVRFNSETSKTGKFARAAGFAITTLVSALSTKAVVSGINRFITLQVTFRTLEKITRALSNAFNFLSTRINETLRLGFETTATYENLRRSLVALSARNLVVSGEFGTIAEAQKRAKTEAEELITIFSRMAILSPFNRDDIARGFRLAQVFGFNREEALALTQTLTDTAAAVGAGGPEIERIVRALGQMRANTTVTKEELNQLSEVGVPAITILARAFDITEKELLDLVRKGVVPAEQAIGAITAALQRDFGGAAAEATQDLSGLLATFQDFRANSLRELFTSSFEALKPFVSELLSLGNIEKSLASTRQFGEILGQRVAVALRFTIALVRDLMTAWREIPTPIKESIVQFAQFAAITASVTLGLGLLQLSLTATAGILFTLLNPISLVIGGITGLTILVIRNADTIKSTFDEIMKSGQQLGSFFQVLTSTLSMGRLEENPFENFAAPLEFIGENVVRTSEFIGILTNSLQQLFTVGEVSSTAFSGFSSIFQTLGNDILSIASLFTGFSDTIMMVAGNIQTGFNTILSTISSAVNSAATFFQSMLTSVAEWGSGLIQAFAQGIISALSIVADALQQLGNLITFWLQPGSPPRLLPNVDQWGKGLADAYLEGLSKADFSLINDFGDTLSDLLQQQDLNLDIDDIVTQFASGLSQLNVDGEIDASLFKDLQDEIGETNTDVLTLTDQYFKLAQAQADLNAITSEYNNELNELQGTIDDISLEASFKKDEQRIQSLNSALENRFITEGEKARIQDEIETITAKRRIKEIQAEQRQREAAVKAAENDIDITKERLKLANQFGDDAAFGGGIAPSLSTDKLPKASKLKEIGQSVEDLAESIFGAGKTISDIEFRLPEPEIGKGILDLAKNIASPVEKVKEQFSTLTTNIRGSIDNIRNAVNGWFEKLGEWGITTDRVIIALGALATAFAIPALLSAITGLGVTLGLILNPIGLTIAAITGLVGGFALLVQQSGSIKGAVNTIKSEFERLKEVFTIGFLSSSEGDSEESGIQAALTKLLEIDITSIDSIVSSIGEVAGMIVSSFDISFRNIDLTSTFMSFKDKIMTGVMNAFDAIKTLFTGDFSIFAPVTNFVSSISTTANTLIAVFKTNFVMPIKDAFQNNSTLLGGIRDAYIALYIGIANLALTTLRNIAFPNVGPTLVDKIIEALNTTEVGQKIEANFAELFSGVDLSEAIQGLQQGITTAVQLITDGFSSIQELFTGDNVLTNILAENIDAFREFFTEISSPEFLNAVGKIAAVIAGLVATVLTLGDAILIGILRNFADLVIGVVAGVERAVIGIRQIIEGNISQGLLNIILGLGDAFDAVFNTIAGIIADAALALLRFAGIDTEPWEGWIRLISSGIVAVATWAASILQLIGSLGRIKTLQPLLSSISNFFGRFSLFGTSVADVGAATGRVLANIAIGTQNAILAVGRLFAQFVPFGSIVQRLNALMTGFIFGILDWFSTIKARIGNVVALLDTIEQPLATIRDSVSNFFGNLLPEIPEQITLADIYSLDPDVTMLTAGISFEGLIDTSQKIAVTLADFFIFTEGERTQLETVIKDFFAPLDNLLGTDVGGFVSKVTISIADFFTIEEGTATQLTNSVKSFFEPLNNLLATSDIDGLIDQTVVTLADFFIFEQGEISEIENAIQTFFAPLDNLLGTDAGGLVSGVAVNIADFISIDETTTENIASSIKLVTDSLREFATLGGVPETVSSTIDNVIGLFTGETSVSETISSVIDVLKEIENLVGVPEIYSTGLETLFNLFTGEVQLAEIINTVQVALNQFAEILPIPETVRSAFSAIFNFFSDTLANTIDNVKLAIEGLISAFDVTIPNPFAEIDEFLDNAGQRIDSFFESLPEVGFELPSFLGGGADVVDTLETDISNETLSVEPTIDFDPTIDTTQLGNAFRQAGKDAGQGFEDGLNEEETGIVATVTNTFNSGISAVTGLFKTQSPSLTMKEIAQDVVAGFVLGLNEDTTLVTALETLANTIVETLTQAFEGFSLTTIIFGEGTDFTSQQQSFSGFSTNVVESFRTFTTQSLQLLVAFSNNAQDEIEDMLNKLLDELEDFTEDWLALVRELVDDTLSEFQRMRDEILEILDNLFTEALDKLDDFVEEFIDRLDGLRDRAVDIVADMVDQIVNELDRLRTEGIASINSFIDAAVIAMQRFSTVMRQAAQDGVNAFIDEINNSAQPVADAISEMLEDAIDLSEPAVISLGVELATSLSDGIISAFQGDNADDNIEDLADAIEDYVKDAINIAEAALGISSPSRETRERLGIPLSEGIVEGVTDNEQLFQNTLSQFLTSGISNLQQSLPALRSRLITFSSSFINLFGNIFDTLVEVEEAFGDNFLGNFDEVTNNSLNLIEQFVDDLVEELETLSILGIEPITSFSENFANIIENGAIASVQALLDTIDSMIDDVSPALTQFLDDLESTFIDDFYAAGQALAEGFSDGFNENVNLNTGGSGGGSNPDNPDIGVGPITPIPQGAGETIAQVGEDLGQVLSSSFRETVEENDNVVQASQTIGENIATGIQQSIEDNSTSIANSLVTALETAVEAGRIALEIQSPSKVAYRDIGIPVIQGISNALTHGISSVSNSMNSIGNAISNTRIIAPRIQNSLTNSITNNSSELNAVRRDMRNAIRNVNIDNSAVSSISSGIANTLANSLSHSVNQLYGHNQPNPLSQAISNLTNSTNSNRQNSIVSSTYSNDHRSTVNSATNNYNLYTTVKDTQATKVRKEFGLMKLRGL